MITIAPKMAEPQKAEPLAVGMAEAAMLLSVSERTLWAWTRDGLVPSVKIRRRVLYPVEGLRQLVSGKNRRE